MAGKNYDEEDIMRIAGIFSEQMDSKIEALLENVDVMIDRRVRPIIQEELVEVKHDIKVINAAVIDNNESLHKLERRVDQLEAA